MGAGGRGVGAGCAEALVQPGRQVGHLDGRSGRGTGREGGDGETGRDFQGKQLAKTSDNVLLPIPSETGKNSPNETPACSPSVTRSGKARTDVSTGRTLGPKEELRPPERPRFPRIPPGKKRKS